MSTQSSSLYENGMEYPFTSPFQIVLIVSDSPSVDDTGRLHAHVAVGSADGLCVVGINLSGFVVECMENDITYKRFQWTST